MINTQHRFARPPMSNNNIKSVFRDLIVQKFLKFPWLVGNDNFRHLKQNPPLYFIPIIFNSQFFTSFNIPNGYQIPLLKIVLHLGIILIGKA